MILRTFLCYEKVINTSEGTKDAINKNTSCYDETVQKYHARSFLATILLKKHIILVNNRNDSERLLNATGVTRKRSKRIPFSSKLRDWKKLYLVEQTNTFLGIGQ